MKKTINILLLLLPFYVMAQAPETPTPPTPPTPPSAPRPESKEKIEAMKVGYITQKLDLTSKEAQSFWPVYNEFNAEIDKIKKERKSKFEDRPEIESLNDKQVEE